MRNLGPEPAILPAMAPDTSDAVHEALLRRGLERSRREKSPEHEETLAHLTALAVHLERMGKTEEARSLHDECDRIYPRVETRKTQERGEMGRAPVERRAAALEAYKTGDYAHAERLLRSLISNGFEVPSTHCHLGRILLMQDRFEEARTETSAAWEHRAQAPSYVVPRILWLQLALLYTSPTEEAMIDSAQVILGRLKTALAREGAHDVEWTMEPVLTYLQPRLPVDQYELLDALVAGLNGTKLPALEQFPVWRDAQPEPLE